jgi:hypothetical protein
MRREEIKQYSGRSAEFILFWLQRLQPSLLIVVVFGTPNLQPTSNFQRDDFGSKKAHYRTKFWNFGARYRQTWSWVCAFLSRNGSSSWSWIFTLFGSSVHSKSWLIVFADFGRKGERKKHRRSCHCFELKKSERVESYFDVERRNVQNSCK